MTREKGSDDRPWSKVNKYMQFAYSYVNDHWIPPNQELISIIQNKIESGVYDDDRFLLIEDLKQDQALFTLCVRGLLHLAPQGSASTVNPILALRDIELQTLAAIIENIRTISNTQHSVSELQTTRIKESCISSAVAELLAPKFDVDADLAFATALFRQLGLTLIAWNYPHVFERVFQELDEETTLEAALNSMLGFSPSTLAITIARQWELSPEIRIGMGDSTLHSEDCAEAKETLKQGACLEHICKIGEALARAQNPDQYPSARQDWSFAHREVLRWLGRDGLRLIQSRVNELARHYNRAIPELNTEFTDGLVECEVQSNQPTVLLLNNLHIKYCPPLVQDLLKEVYRSLDNGRVSSDGVTVITHDIIPTAGFDQGCIFLIDPETRALVPRLAIGSSSLDEFKPIPVTMDSKTKDPILSAFKSNVPIVQESTTEFPFIAAGLGKLQRTGVLLLFQSKRLTDNRSANPLVYFKALCQAVSDALGLH